MFMDGGEERCSGGKLDWNVGVECGSENVLTVTGRVLWLLHYVR